MNMFERELDWFTKWLEPSISSWRMTPWLMRDDLSSVQASVVRVVALAHAENLPLAPLMQHFANEHRGAARRRLRKFANRLDSGTPLITALEETPDVLNDEDVLTLRFATQSGTLSTAMDELRNKNMRVSQLVSVRLLQSKIYFLGLFFVIVLATVFLLTFIAPTFREMLEELGDLNVGRNSQSFLGLLVVTGALFRYAPMVIAVAVMLAALVWLFKPGRVFRRTFASRLLRPVAQARTAHLLRMLSMASDAGRPLPGSLSTLARYHFDKTIRSKLLFSRNEVEQGAEAWKSMAAASLLSSNEAEALAATDSPQLRTWMLRRLAQWKEDRYQLRSSVLVALIHPAIVVLFGALVLWLATAFFGVLCNLIQSLSLQMG